MALVNTQPSNPPVARFIPKGELVAVEKRKVPCLQMPEEEKQVQHIRRKKNPAVCLMRRLPDFTLRSVQEMSVKFPIK